MTQFNPSEHITKLPQGKDKTSEYLEVKWRLCWFRDQCSEGSIVTELVTLDLDRSMTAEVYAWSDQTKRKEKVQKTANGWCLFKATVSDGKGGIATAHGSESAVDFADYVEKAETKAVGRALAYLGYGTQFAPELNEEHRIVDAPVEPKSVPPASGNIELDGMPPSAGQLENIRQLALHLGTKISKPKTFKEAAQVLDSMQSEWDQMKSRGRAS